MPAKSVAIVTGASQGIGRATAIRLARDFQALVLAARKEDERHKTACAVESAGAEPLTCAIDLREPCSARALIDLRLDRLGRIDALLNIAGAVPQVDLFEMTDEQWEDGATLKLQGARRLTIRAWEALKAANGAVVFISGSAALDPKPGLAALATINAAIIARQCLCRPRHQGWSPSQQRRARRRDDGPPTVLHGEMGARSRNERRKGPGRVPEKAGIPATVNRKKLPA
jgi:3-oxoacyl-[acyl-carrier protein] reductase